MAVSSLRIGPLGLVAAVWPFIRPERGRLLDAATTTLALTAVEISLPLLGRTYLDWIGGQPAGQESAVSQWVPSALIALLLAGALARGYLLTRQRSLAGRIGERAAARLRTRLWSHLQELPLEHTQSRGPGRLLVSFISDIRAVQRLVTEGLIQGTQELLLLALVLLVLALLNWRMALPVLLLVPLYAGIFWAMNPKLRRASRATRRRRSRLSAYLNERILAMKVVKAHVRQRSEATRVRRMTRELAERGAQAAATAGTLQGTTVAAVSCGVALTLALAPAELAAGRATGGTLVAFIMFLALLTPILRRLSRLNRSLQEATISVERLQATLAKRPESRSDGKGRTLRVRDGAVAVKGVSFVQSDGGRVLRGVRLRARRGELVAIVGPTGSGKSTLLDLMLRFKEPTAGRIVIDRRRIDNVSLESLRSQVGWVPQDALLLDGTILENVAYGTRHDCSPDEIERAVRLAGVDEIATRLPDGLNTRVGPSGQALSHGQRQRVALARALVGDPPILVIDEVSSGGDAEGEQALARRLRALAEQKTVIAATHQLATLLVADRIYVLDRGRIVERGSHAKLMARGKAYARLFENRSGPDEGRRTKDEESSRSVDRPSSVVN